MRCPIAQQAWNGGMQIGLSILEGCSECHEVLASELAQRPVKLRRAPCQHPCTAHVTCRSTLQLFGSIPLWIHLTGAKAPEARTMFIIKTIPKASARSLTMRHREDSGEHQPESTTHSVGVVHLVSPCLDSCGVQMRHPKSSKYP